MRKDFYFRMALFFGLVIFFGCKKVEEPQGGGGEPQVPDLARTFQLVVNSLPGETSALAGLSAIVSLTDGKGDTVIKNKRVLLNYEQEYTSDSLQLEKGSYDLVKFWILKDDQVLFVTPRIGSAKASLVATPFPYLLSLVAKDHKLQTIEVAKVGENDRAEDFGYSPGDFGKPDTGPVEDPNAVVDIWIHPKIRIGDVVYDSVPVSVTIQTWDATGQVVSAIRPFMAGRNKVSVPKSAAKHVFRLEKWGTSDELTITKDQLLPNSSFTLGGTVAAKRLSEVLTYKIIAGVSKPETRTLYQYNGSGKLTEIQTYRKRADQSNYLDTKELIEYSGDKVVRISRYNEFGEIKGSTIFDHQADGRVSHIVDVSSDNRTTAEVSYTGGEGGHGNADNFIDVRYSYSHHYYTTSYNLSVKGGTVVRSVRSSTNGAYEEGQYQYDFSINPYVHLNLPDLYLSAYSKHNRIREVKQYAKDYPLEDAYQYSYKYNGDGYPAELVVKYKTYLTGQHAYDIKTVFKY